MNIQSRLFKIIAVLICFSFFEYQVGVALPEIQEIVSGTVSLDVPDDKTMNITASADSIINYKSFSIAEDEKVMVTLPSTSDAILNRVTGGIPSELFGELLSNGIFLLVNSAGIHVGETATINTAGLILSTRDITNTDFLNGNYTFRKLSNEDLDGFLVNDGNITVQAGGFVSFIAGALENNGTVIAPLGRVALAGGD
ncbi:MAG: filamentous hemagglutinin N-terminal domain-containing protein, partial [Candidatus Altiarchaeota archaeon]|nr:filamentous hemagglutinin N-terminal domain-containing protein [Candidatus Altiarchaeota archaeon]